MFPCATLVGAAKRLPLLLLLAAAPAAAADPSPPEPGPWDLGAVVGLNLSQSAYSSNWSGGDVGSVVWVVHSDMSAERQFTTRFDLKNVLQLAYGQTSKQRRDATDPTRLIWDRPEKSTDQVVLESTGRFTLQKWVDPYLAFRAETQFLDQSDPRGALRFNPVKLTESAGFARVFQKTADRELITRLGLALRESFGREFTGPSGGATRSFTTQDGGFEWQTTATQPVLDKAVLYKGRLLVYLPMFYTQSDALKRFDELALAVDPTRPRVANYWKAPDVDFQSTFTAQIAKYLSVNLYLELMYDKFDAATEVDTSKDPALLIPIVDHSVRKAGQFKQTLALGLTYTLF